MLSESRYAILNYSDDYSKHTSGVVYDIVFSCCPVVGRRCGALKFIEDNKIGFLYDDIDSFDAKRFLQEHRREEFLPMIDDYLAKHQLYARQLKEFVLS